MLTIFLSLASLCVDRDLFVSLEINYTSYIFIILVRGMFFSQDALNRANEVMGSSLTQQEVKIHVVRDVAPNKPMLCLSFLAPDAGGSDNGGCDDNGAAETPAGTASGATPAATTAAAEAAADPARTASGTTAASASAVVRSAATATASSDDSREGMGGVEEEASGSSSGTAACNKRQRTEAVPKADDTGL